MTGIDMDEPREAVPVEIATYRLTPVAASLRAARTKPPIGYVVVKITRGLRLNGECAWTDIEHVAGSASHPLAPDAAKRALHALARGAAA